MKTNILLLYQNIKDFAGMKAGLDLARKMVVDSTRTEISLNIGMRETNRQFSGEVFSNSTVGQGACVKEIQILQEAVVYPVVNYQIACLIYDWDKIVLPKPTNPVHSQALLNGMTPIQIPVQFYSDFTKQPAITYSQVLCDYFLHELCHAFYFLAGDTMHDITHYQQSFPEWQVKQPSEYYCWIISVILKDNWSSFAQNTMGQYIFNTNLQQGDKNNDVIELQKKLIAEHFLAATPTGFFGQLTFAAVKAYQKLHGLPVTGFCGPMTRAYLNKPSLVHIGDKTKLELWCEAIKEMENANLALNNPGNIKYVGQRNAIRSSNGFCIFPDYATGYMALENTLINAATDKAIQYGYHSSMTLVEFYEHYAPANDGNNPQNYARFVAGIIGVPVETQIKDLL